MLPLLVSTVLHSFARANIKACLFGGVENVSLKPSSCGLTWFLILCKLEQGNIGGIALPTNVTVGKCIPSMLCVVDVYLTVSNEISSIELKRF